MIKFDGTDKIKVFTHTDLDGVGSVVILKTLLDEDQVDYECHNYDTINQAIIDYEESKEYLNYTATFITDISVNEEAAINAISRIWNNTNCSIALFDHHKTAESLNNYLWARIDTEGYHCGTSLFYEWILSKGHKLHQDITCLSDIVEQIRSYDTWEWTKTGNDSAKNLNRLFGIKGRERFIFDVCLCEKYPATYEECGKYETDELLLRIEDEKIERYIKSKTSSIIELPNQYENYTAGLVYAEQYVSELGDSILKYNQHIDYVMIVDMSKKAVSLRSRDNGVNVKELAELNNGGGHFASSGYRLKTNKDRTISLWL